MSRSPKVNFISNFMDTKAFNKINRDRVSAGKNKIILSEKLDYLSRDEAINHEDDFFKITSGYLTRDNAISDNSSLFIDEEEIIYYDKNGIVKRDDMKRRKSNIDFLSEYENKDNMCLYQNIISFNDEMKNQIKGKYTQKELFELLELEFKKFLIHNEFEINNIEYYMSFHSNTDNFHCHLDFMEIEPTRTKNMLKESKFDYIKKNIVFSLDYNCRNEYDKILENINKDVKTRKKSIDRVCDNIFAYISDDDLNVLNDFLDNNYVPFYGSIKDQEVKTIVDKIYDSLQLDFESELELFHFSKEIWGDSKSQAMHDEKISRDTISSKNQLFRALKNIDNQSKNEILKIFVLKKQQNIYDSYKIPNKDINRKLDYHTNRLINQLKKNKYNKDKVMNQAIQSQKEIEERMIEGSNELHIN